MFHNLFFAKHSMDFIHFGMMIELCLNFYAVPPPSRYLLTFLHDLKITNFDLFS